MRGKMETNKTDINVHTSQPDRPPLLAGQQRADADVDLEVLVRPPGLHRGLRGPGADFLARRLHGLLPGLCEVRERFLAHLVARGERAVGG